MWLSDKSLLRIAEELFPWEEAISQSFAEGGLWGEEGGLRGGGDGQKCPELPLTELQLHKVEVNSEPITNFVGTQHIPRKSKSFTLIKFNRFHNLKHLYSTSNFRHIPKTENVGWEFQTWELKLLTPAHPAHLPPPCCLLRPPCRTYQGCECSAWQERKPKICETWIQGIFSLIQERMENLLSIISDDFIVCMWLRKWIAGDKIGHDYDLYSDDAHPVTYMFFTRKKKRPSWALGCEARRWENHKIYQTSKSTHHLKGRHPKKSIFLGNSPEPTHRLGLFTRPILPVGPSL